MAKTSRAATKLIKLKVTLQGIRPPIWRRLLMPGWITLGDLHWAIQATMGWGNCHLHQFDIADRVYGDPQSVDSVDDEECLTLDKVVRSHVARFLYTYDFGDDWEHVITIEGTQPTLDGEAYPACVAGRRNGPPEDCGGCWGYQEMLNALADPDHPGHDQWIEMTDDGFDPEAFSAKAANALLAYRFGQQGAPTIHPHRRWTRG
ncbi:MAG: plasmid pRiA4b ORF-3 family protein [Geminicoccaceae bacterium]